MNKAILRDEVWGITDVCHVEIAPQEAPPRRLGWCVSNRTRGLKKSNWKNKLGHQNSIILVQGLGDKSVEAFPIGSWAFSATQRTVFAPATAPQVTDFFPSPQITVYCLLSCYIHSCPKISR